MYFIFFDNSHVSKSIYIWRLKARVAVDSC